MKAIYTKVMKNTVKIFLILSLFLGLFTSCEKDDKGPSVLATEDSIYYFIDGLMDYWYLWNDSIPEVDYLNYSTPQELMNDLIVSIDHWSFVDKEATVNSLFTEGEDFGFGFFLGWDNEPSYSTTQLRVLFVYNNTDAYNAGIRRGCIIEEIDDVPVKEITSFDPFFSSDEGTMKFDYIDNFGNQQTTTLTKKKYNMNAVLFSDTYEVSGKTTGYMVFQSFLGYSKDELEETIDFFKGAGITELIVDLRYNGGGYVSISEELANMIIPSSVVGETFYSNKHNSDRSDEYDTSVTFKADARNLNLQRVFFITNQYSASASELVINGLNPHLDVIQIGNTTYGKPVTMYGFLFQDWLAYPVTAKSVNSVNFGGYFNGLSPDKQVTDQHKYNWGDETEPALSQAFYYITYGSFDEQASALKTTVKAEVVSDKVFRNRNMLLMDR